MLRIQVAGDIVRNTNLVRLPPDASPLPENLPSTSIRHVLGGANYLKTMLEIACSDLDAAVMLEDRAAGDVARLPDPGTLTIWAQRPRSIGSSSWVWRVEQFMRLQAPDRGDPAGQAEDAPDPRSPADSRLADLLVLDDESLGFRDSPERWQPLLNALEPHGQIVLKTRSPLGDGPLWQELITHHRERLTVVVPASSLRARHGSISRGLSWDRTIEDVHRELTRGASEGDIGLAQRIVIPFSYEGVAVFTRSGSQPLQLDRFIFHPEQLEGTQRSRQPGRMLGGISLLTAVVVRHLARPGDYPAFVALGRGLSAMSWNHDRGGGSRGVGDPLTQVLVPFSDDTRAQRELAAILHWPDAGRENGHAVVAPESAYRSAFNLQSSGVAGDAPTGALACSLLGDVTGPSAGHVLAAAIQTVVLGSSRALDSAPRARYADFTTFDRDEIERTNEIHRLFQAYRANNDRVPLSIAVFGPPGSGKSFAIKQLAAHLFGRERETLEWNLSQMADRSDLLTAFDQIRDASVRGKIPLVFWDEFDSNELAWLKEFLAPMQDAQYCAGSLTHPFAKVIFVFAGGTSSTFQEFDRSRANDSFFRNRKGPDFVSRLRGYINIKGPNPPRDANQVSSMHPAPVEQGVPGDATHLIRRAFLLRSVVARNAPHLIDPETDVAAISPSVIRGFLCVDTFHHGARSIEQVVKMSDLANASRFDVAQLPSPAMLTLHVSDDFMHRVAEADTEEAAAALLSESPSLVMLDQEVHSPERRRHHARVLIEGLRQIGYRIVRAGSLPGEGQEQCLLSAADTERLARIEHKQWLRDQLLRGFDYGSEPNPSLRLHPAVRRYEDLAEEWRERLHRRLSDSIAHLHNNGFSLAPI